VAVYLVKPHQSIASSAPGSPAACASALSASQIPKPKRNRKMGGARPLPISTVDLSQSARLRVGHLLTLLSVSSGEFYKRKKAGELPPQDGYDGRPFWFIETIRPLIKAVK
jgi:hypothetical protein